MSDQRPIENERRKHDRTSIVGQVHYTGGDGVVCTAIKDISFGGVRLYVTAAEKPGRKVSLRLTFADEVTLELKGQVVWARQVSPYEIGVQFLAVEDDAARLLGRQLSQLT